MGAHLIAMADVEVIAPMVALLDVQDVLQSAILDVLMHVTVAKVHVLRSVQLVVVLTATQYVVKIVDPRVKQCAVDAPMNVLRIVEGAPKHVPIIVLTGAFLHVLANALKHAPAHVPINAMGHALVC